MAQISFNGFRTFSITACFAVLGMVWGSTPAADLWVEIKEPDDAGVENAIVEVSKLDPPPLAATPPVAQEMRQSGKAFRPFVLVVPVGASVDFPNQDPFRHHVYSFSKPKPFELKLYGQSDIPKVVFDQPGIVALGCNIHDQMRGYIYVTAAPRYGLTDGSGSVGLKDLAPGKYRATVWHPDLRNAGGVEPQDFAMPESGDHHLQFRIELKPAMPKAAPSEFDNAGEY